MALAVTGWAIVGAVLLALPFLVLGGFMFAEDPEACCLTVMVTGAIAAVVIVGSLLVSGEWTP